MLGIIRTYLGTLHGTYPDQTWGVDRLITVFWSFGLSFFLFFSPFHTNEIVAVFVISCRQYKVSAGHLLSRKRATVPCLPLYFVCNGVLRM